MWNMNDVYAASERMKEIRRNADKRNAIARLKTAGQGERPEQRSGEKQQKLWERMRSTLR